MNTLIKERLGDVLLNSKVASSRKRDSNYPSAASVEYINEHKERTVAGKCLRRQYYEKREMPAESIETPEGLMKAKAGDVWSDWLSDKLKEAGCWAGTEVSFYNKSLNLSGRIDAVIKDINSDNLVGVEFKTVGTFVSQGVIKPTAKYPLAPKEEHVLQVMLYLWHYKDYDIDKWVLFYMNRDSFEQREHIVRLGNHDGEVYPIIMNEMGTLDWTHLTLNNIISRWHQLELALKENKLPDRDYEVQYSNQKIIQMYKRNQLNKTESSKVQRALTKFTNIDNSETPILTKGDWQCRFCPYAELCYSNLELNSNELDLEYEL